MVVFRTKPSDHLNSVPSMRPSRLKIRLGDVDAGGDADLVEMRLEPLPRRGAAELEEIVEELGIGVELARGVQLLHLGGGLDEVDVGAPVVVALELAAVDQAVDE